jgi:hypothetical protein
MNVIRHDDVATNSPEICRLPRCDDQSRCFVIRAQSSPVRAHREEDDDRSESSFDCRKVRQFFPFRAARQRSRASQSSALHLPLPSCLRFLISRFQHANAFVDEWQTDRQSKTFALAALEGELATVLAHDSAYNQ